MNISETEAREILSKRNIALSSENLVYYAQEGDLPTVDLIINAGVHTDSFGTSVNGNTKFLPLNQAALRGHVQVLEYLLEHGTLPNLVDGDGNTALFKGIYGKHIDVVRVLIKRGADINWTAQNGNNALYLSRKYKHSAITEILLEAGAKDKGINKRKKLKRLAAIKWSTLFVAFVGLTTLFSSIDKSDATSSSNGRDAYTKKHECKWCGKNYTHNGYFHIESNCEKWSTDPGYDAFCTMKCCMNSWNSGINRY